MPNSRAEIEDEIRIRQELRRRKASRNLTDYIKYIEVPGAPISDDEEEEKFYPEKLVPAHHHKLVIELLEAVERGDVPRAMIFAPPGSAKSTYGTVCFPTYLLGKYPRKQIISMSYGMDLAKKFGRKCRQITRSPEYSELFDTTIRSDNAAANEWSLESGSEYMAGGMLTGVTGNRADGIVIDDPIKGRKSADSPMDRNTAWDTYLADIRTRMKPHCFILFILTRWHEDDPVGRILPEDYNGETGWVTARDGERWYVLSLQAECEREDDPLGREIGEYIWPEWFPKEHFEQEKITQGPRNWSALYQQRPAPEEGDYFQRDWIRWYDWNPAEKNNGAPAHLKLYGASDYAVSDGEGDWTVHGVGGVDPNDDLYILDWWRKQTASDVWIETFIDLMAKWETTAWGEESGQIKKSLEPFIDKRMRERQVYRYRHQFPSAADKAMRAQAIRGRMAMGKVYLPRNAPWTEQLVSELMRFTGATGDVDDQVDVLSLFGRMLSGMKGGVTPPKPEKERKKPTMDEVWKQHEKNKGRGTGRI